VCVANDVGQGCYGAMKVRDAFANAYRELRDAVLPQYEHLQSNCSSFLGRILLVPLEVVKYRHVIQKRWQIRPCSLSSSSSSSSAADDPPSYSEHLPSSSSSVAAAAAAVGDTLLTQLIDDRHVLHYTVGSCQVSSRDSEALADSTLFIVIIVIVVVSC